MNYTFDEWVEKHGDDTIEGSLHQDDREEEDE
jgi:hypothetical protein